MATKKNAVQITWPEGYFTIDDMKAKHPTMVEITLRFRVKKAQNENEIVVIGRLKPSIGRPKLVFAKANPSPALIKKAYSEGILPPKDDSVSVPVADVKTEQKTTAYTSPVEAQAATSTVPMSVAS